MRCYHGSQFALVGVTKECTAGSILSARQNVYISNNTIHTFLTPCVSCWLLLWRLVWSWQIHALWNRVPTRCSLSLVASRLSIVPAIKSRNIVQAHQSEACWENESPLKLSVITVQQETSKKFLKSDEMSPSIIISRLVDSWWNSPHGVSRSPQTLLLISFVLHTSRVMVVCLLCLGSNMALSMFFNGKMWETHPCWTTSQ